MIYSYKVLNIGKKTMGDLSPPPSVLVFPPLHRGDFPIDKLGADNVTIPTV